MAATRRCMFKGDELTKSNSFAYTDQVLVPAHRSRWAVKRETRSLSDLRSAANVCCPRNGKQAHGIDHAVRLHRHCVLHGKARRIRLSARIPAKTGGSGERGGFAGYPVQAARLAVIGLRSCSRFACGEAGEAIITVYPMSNSLFPCGRTPVLAVLPALLSSAFAAAQTTEPSTEIPLLPQVVVTANRYEQDVKSIPAQVTVITREQMEAANVSTINEAIARLGGIATRTSLTGGNELTIDPLGFGDTAGSNTVILIDGVPIREGDMSEVRLSGLPVESVERIEVQRSSGSVLYGGGATAGVINIITRASGNDPKAVTSGSVYAGAGSFSTTEFRANARYVKDGLDLSLAATNRDSDGFRRHSGSNDKGLLVTAKYAASFARFGISFSSESNTAQTPGSLTLTEYRTDPRMAQPASVANNTRSDIETSRFAAFAETELAGVQWRVDASTRQRDLDAVAVMGGFPVPLQYRGDDQFISLSGQRLDDVAIGRNRLVFGVEHGDWSQRRNYPGSTLGSYQLDFTSTSHFIKDDLDITSLGVRVTAGYRSERNERSQLGLKFGDQIDNRYTRSAWELGVSKELDSDNHVYARIATSYRFANIDEFTTSYSPDYAVLPLRPQTSQDQEIGWKHQFGSRGRFDLRIYRSELENEIAYNNYVGLDSFGYVQGSNVNLSPTRRQGIDADVSYQLTSRWLVASSLSIRDARFRSGEFEGKRVPMSAREIISLRSEYAVDSRQKVGAMARWVSSQYVAMDFNNQSRMPSYAVADLYYQYKAGKFDLSVKALNIFDKTYYSYATRTWDPTSSFQYTAVFPDAGRSLWFSARYRF